MNRKYDYIINEFDENKRLDVFLSEKFTDKSRSYFTKLISEKMVTVNQSNKKAGFKLEEGMIVSVTIPQPELLNVIPENISLDIIYEDSDIIIINKPKDLVVHPSAGHSKGTLVNALLSHCKDSLSDINGVIRPGIVHRIDKDTTGLICVAKNNISHLHLAQQLKTHSMERIYESIIDGVIKTDKGIINAPIGRHPNDRKKMAVTQGKGKDAITHYEVLERFKKNTYVRLRLETGRTHQIRVHMSYIGYPIHGDPLYSKVNKSDKEGQYLHARFLHLTHPKTGERMMFEAPLPENFILLLNKLS